MKNADRVLIWEERSVNAWNQFSPEWEFKLKTIFTFFDGGVDRKSVQKIPLLLSFFKTINDSVLLKCQKFFSIIAII